MATMSHYHLHLHPLALQGLPSRRRLHRLQGHAALGPGCLHHDPAAADGVNMQVYASSKCIRGALRTSDRSRHQ